MSIIDTLYHPYWFSLIFFHFWTRAHAFNSKSRIDLNELLKVLSHPAHGNSMVISW